MALNLDLSRQKFAYDLAQNVTTKGEVFDTEAINQSIHNILSTTKGERVFLPQYGSVLPLVVFERINETNGEELLDRIIDDVEFWENRITIIRSQAKISLKIDENSLTLTIPYKIKQNGITSTFVRLVRF